MTTLGWDSGGFQYSSCHLLHPIQTYFLSCSSCLQEPLLLPHLHSLDTTTSWHGLQYPQLFSGAPQPFFLDNLHVFLPPMDLTSTSIPYQGPKLTVLFQDPKRAATATKEHPPHKGKTRYQYQKHLKHIPRYQIPAQKHSQEQPGQYESSRSMSPYCNEPR